MQDEYLIYLASAGGGSNYWMIESLPEKCVN